MEIKIEIDDAELKDQVLDYLIRKELNKYEFTKYIKREIKPILNEISSKYRS